jgi:aryl-alcohol dehydrogenase-like predicted oxidoreductase
MIPTRELGRSGLWVAPLAFGGNVFGWTADEGASFAVLLLVTYIPQISLWLPSVFR